MSKTTIVIADDHPLLLKGLKDFLLEQEIDVLATSTDGQDALNQIIKHKPQLAILDLEMPNMTGLEIASECKKRALPTKIILLTLHKEMYLYNQAKELNLSGYILKEFALGEVSQAIDSILAGKTFFSETIFKNQESDTLKTESSPLTPSEKKILRLIAQGESTKQIAEKLFISERTVDKHRSNMISKLNLEKKHNSLLLWAQKNREIIN
ncbi:response regulator [Algoriphagus machipongonensis]|uniref:DNA-binding response regulator n=1 Tax=Algoriphagus machipongonensis TaxID=388413 RepID=A3HVU5_9BACT|nr:response regulator transcription factor [Algoriphagus machipongonensis]EAZ82267.1 DNA-binding response regulator [Algoriphagus machipongonensis]